MTQHYKVVIIGAGTAGLSARREVAKQTDDYLIIDGGPLGTTCARVGCMPSKVLIQVADDYHRRHSFAQQGIQGGEHVSVDLPQVLAHVRSLRDRFVKGVKEDMEPWLKEKFMQGFARFTGPQTIQVGDRSINADRFIVATGSKPIIPKAWQPCEDFLLDTDGFFEQDTLPESVVVVGLGVIGLELGQALARLGVEVTGISLDKAYGGLSDPDVQAEAHAIFAAEFPVVLSPVEKLTRVGDEVEVQTEQKTIRAKKVLVTMGRRPQFQNLNLEATGAEFDENGRPIFEKSNFRINGTNIFYVGDVNGHRPLLHEASDQGRIAGYNALRVDSHCFRQRPLVTIVFSDPNIAMVGESYRSLKQRAADFVIGEVSFRGQGRAIVKLKEKGLLRVYVDRTTGLLLGAEMIAPDGEHLAHLLVWAMGAQFTVKQILALPFYHPVTAEGLRTALRQAAKKIPEMLGPLELLRCQEAPVV